MLIENESKDYYFQGYPTNPTRLRKTNFILSLESLPTERVRASAGNLMAVLWVAFCYSFGSQAS
jgi:hypothetical protein